MLGRPLSAMLTIYAIPVSLYCAKLRILLRHKGLVWQELPPPGGYGSSDYKKIISSGNLPALQDGDLLLGDSEAIAEYLEEKYPEPATLPSDLESRAKVRERSRFHDPRLEPVLRSIFPFLPPALADEAFIKAQSNSLNERLAQLACLLADDTANAGKELTLADCGFAISFTWIEALTPVFALAIEWPDSVIRYRRDISRLPAVAAELKEYSPRLAAWLAERAAP